MDTDTNENIQKTTITKPLIEWIRGSFGMEFKSIQDLVKRKYIKVNDILIRNSNYIVKEGDVVTINNKSFLVTFEIKKKAPNANR